MGVEIAFDKEGGVIGTLRSGIAFLDVFQSSRDCFEEDFFGVRSQPYDIDVCRLGKGGECEEEAGQETAHLSESDGENDEGPGLSLLVDLRSEVPLIVDFQGGRREFATGELVSVAE